MFHHLSVKQVTASSDVSTRMEELSSVAADELLKRAAAGLVAESAVEMSTDRGQTVEVWTIAADGPRVAASAPRLDVAVDMRLECRLTMEGTTYRISAVAEQAYAHSASRAKLVLRVIDALADVVVRRAERVEVSVRATLVSVVCDRIVPNEALPVVVDDVSEGGFQATLSDPRVRVDDRLRMVGRLVEGPLDTEVRVRWAADTGRGVERRIGCAFIDPPAASQQTIDRLLRRFATPATQEALAAFRLAQTFYVADRQSPRRFGATGARRPRPSHS
jgi:PilZ domain